MYPQLFLRTAIIMLFQPWLSNAKYEIMLPQAGTLGGLRSNVERKKSAFITKIS